MRERTTAVCARGTLRASEEPRALSFPVSSVRAACAALLLLGACGDPAPPAHPNVIVLLADDLGAGDVGWTGLAAEPIPTPNLDAFAARGLVLDQLRTAPLCTPARAALLTGRAPARLGLLRNISAKDTGGLDPSAPTLAETLRDAGYATELVGKWHLGHATPGQRPLQRGFESFVGVLGGWIDYQTHARGKVRDWWRGDEAFEQEGHATRLLADEAVRAIRERDRAKPLYLHVAFTAPHAPTSVPPGRSISEVPGSDVARRQYALLVDELDRAVGRVLAALDAEGLRERTIVLFASDNGAPSGFGGSNGTLREGKGTVWDGALRVPAILAWPGTLAPGRSAVALQGVDVAPTLCAAAGVALAADPARDGADLWPALARGAEPPRRTAVFGVERAGGVDWAAFDGRWKLVAAANAAAPALYDVRTDPGEARDLASREAEIVARLAADLAPWRALPHLPFAPDEAPQRGISGDDNK